MPMLTALYRYPVKSAHGDALTHCRVDARGLPDDRSWMVADPDGRFITGRECPQLVTVSATVDEAGLHVAAPGREPLTVSRAAFTEPHPAVVWRDGFEAWHGPHAADDWFSDFLGRPVRLMHTGDTRRRVSAFPDIPLSFADGFPLLLIGDASRRQLEHWVGRPLEMARFRPNLVIDGADAFAEDGWKRLRIGEVELELVRPCERCVFTTIDPDTGVRSADGEPLRTLARYRRGERGVLFGQNALVRRGGMLTVGSAVEILEAA